MISQECYNRRNVCFTCVYDQPTGRLCATHYDPCYKRLKKNGTTTHFCTPQCADDGLRIAEYFLENANKADIDEWSGHPMDVTRACHKCNVFIACVDMSLGCVDPEEDGEKFLCINCCAQEDHNHHAEQNKRQKID